MTEDGLRGRQDAVRDFRQRGASLGRHRHEFPFSVGSKSQASLDIIRLQIRKISEDFLFRHASSEIFKYVINGDPEASNTRFPPSFSRFHRDAFAIRHGFQFTRAILSGQQWMHKCTYEKSVSFFILRQTAWRPMMVLASWITPSLIRAMAWSSGISMISRTSSAPRFCVPGESSCPTKM